MSEKKLLEQNASPVQKRHMGLRATRAISNTAIYALLIAISVIWLIPFVCILLQSFRVESTWQVGYVIPQKWGFDNYVNLFQTDFPRWYTNTFIAALVTAVLQTIIVLCMSYTLSRFRFKMRKPLMRFMLILGSIMAVTAPAATPTPMEMASPVSFITFPPFGISMPSRGEDLSGKVCGTINCCLQMKERKRNVIPSQLASWRGNPLQISGTIDFGFCADI